MKMRFSPGQILLGACFTFTTLADTPVQNEHNQLHISENHGGEHIFTCTIDQHGQQKCSIDESEHKPQTLEELWKADPAWVGMASYIHSVPPVKREMAMGVKFKNFYSETLSQYYLKGGPGGEEVYSGKIYANGGFGATNSYTTHTFIFRDKNGKEIDRKTMKDGQNIYIIEPDDAAVLETEAYKLAVAEANFMESYMKEKGTPWLQIYGRKKPEREFWPADYIGQTHHVTSPHTYHICDPREKSPEECILGGTQVFNLTVLSREPRVVAIPNALSEWECDYMVDKIQSRLGRSSVGNSGGGFQSNTRTSKTGWLRRDEDEILGRIFDRYAKLLRVPDDKMHHGSGGVCENLQLVRYEEGQEYAPHHDFGYTGRPNQRFLTFGVHVHPSVEGGETGFPKAFGGKGLKVKPTKGSGVIFYSMLPDGNADDKSLHAGMPVKKGLKYFSNLWIWDPYH